MRKGLVTSGLMAVSALLGLAILSTDHNLWTYEPSHAYGLIAFVIIDVVGIGLVLWKGSRMVLMLGGAWGAIFALLQVSDIYSGGAASIGLTPDQFAAYLFALAYPDSNHIAVLSPALLVVNILVAVVGFMESRRSRGGMEGMKPVTQVTQ